MSFTAVVMAAGQGTRMRSKLPKVLHPVAGRPMVHWPVLAAREAGAAALVVVGGPDGHLEGRLPDGVLLAEQPVADGTGGAVLAAADHVDPSRPVVVLSGDVPLVSAEAIAALVAAHAASGAAATMATTRLADPSGYGRVVRGSDGLVERVVETKVAGDANDAELALDEVNVGIFCFDGTLLLDALRRIGTDNAQGERYLPEVLPILRGDGHAVGAHVVDDPALVMGVNDRAQLAAVTLEAHTRIRARHLAAGVTFLDPPSAWIDADVVIGADTTIEPSVTLRGATVVGEGCKVGPFAVAVDATLEDGASMGPFAYLRPGTVLREGARVGTYVEIKNSDIGPGSKVPHLSYVGDADVGARTNLGAGTITANYDGRRKHRTTIGSDVRGAVHVSYVAPVRIGDGAWTAAGSTITKDVPPGALGVARERQRNVEGYAARSEAPE